MKQYLNKEFLLSNKQLVIKATAIIVILAVAFFVFLAGYPCFVRTGSFFGKRTPKRRK